MKGIYMNNVYIKSKLISNVLMLDAFLGVVAQIKLKAGRASGPSQILYFV